MHYVRLQYSPSSPCLLPGSCDHARTAPALQRKRTTSTAGLQQRNDMDENGSGANAILLQNRAFRFAMENNFQMTIDLWQDLLAASLYYVVDTHIVTSNSNGLWAICHQSTVNVRPSFIFHQQKNFLLNPLKLLNCDLVAYFNCAKIKLYGPYWAASCC